MILKHAYSTRDAVPARTMFLFTKKGSLFIREGADIDVENPWEFDNWNLTAQGQFLMDHGLAISVAFANNAGTIIGATKPVPPKPNPLQVLIQKQVTNIGGTSTGSSDSGSSGDGPPSS